MIKKLIHTSDIHIRTYKRHDEYREIIKYFIAKVKELIKGYEYDEVRIVLVGDVVHQKITISNELTDILTWYFNEMVKLAPVILIAGNHDLLEENQDRMDSLTPVINLINNPNIHYFKETKCYEDDNIMWAVYSIFEGNSRPEIEECREQHPNKSIVGLFHAPVVGSETSVGFKFKDGGVSPEYFNGCDMTLLGDIHKRNEFTNIEGNPIKYCGSLIQQGFGESVSGHGFLEWDVETKTSVEHDIESIYGFYQFGITSLDDLDNNNEKLTNV